jgi:hypothetical protein
MRKSCCPSSASQCNLTVLPREPNLVFLLVVNFLDGVIWAGLSLGLQNYVFIRSGRRTARKPSRCTAQSCGGWSVGPCQELVSRAPSSRIEWAESSSSLHQFAFVFFLSGVLRLLVSIQPSWHLRSAKWKAFSATTPLGIALVRPLLGLWSGPCKSIGRVPESCEARRLRALSCSSCELLKSPINNSYLVESAAEELRLVTGASRDQREDEQPTIMTTSLCCIRSVDGHPPYRFR